MDRGRWERAGMWHGEDASKVWLPFISPTGRWLPENGVEVRKDEVERQKVETVVI
jgi:hypothetical protein